MIIKKMKFLLNWKKIINFKYISYGYSELYFPPLYEIFLIETLFNIKNIFTILTGNTSFLWRKNWILIGLNELGDYIYVDLKNKHGNVYCLTHDALEFRSEEISVSIDKFIKIIEILKEYSKDKDNPVQLEKNKNLDKRPFEILKEIEEINNGLNFYFWELFLKMD